MKIPCTVGILTKNSGRSLERALESVKDFDEIIICDGGSADDTLEIAKRYGAKIIEQGKKYLDENGYICDFSGVRNQTVEAARHDWYFWIDSDEYASPELVENVRRIIADRQSGAFNVSRRYIRNGKEIMCSTSYPNLSMRLFSKKSVSGFRKIVHERPQLNEGVSAQFLDGKLWVPYAEDRARVRANNDRYIALEVKRKGYVGIIRFVAYSWLHLRASMVFLLRLANIYLFCGGDKLPFRSELERHGYHLRLMYEIWRARSREYEPCVLFLVNKWKTGGAEHVFLQEFQALKNQNIAVRFGSVYGQDIPPDVLPDHVMLPALTSLYDISGYVRILRYFGNYGVTHVAATLEHANIVARIVGLFAPHVKVVIIESGMADRKPWRYKLLDLLLNWRCSAVVAGSSGVKASLLKYQSMYAKKMVVLLNGVAVPEHKPARHEPGTFTFLAVGSLRTEKGFGFLLEAFADLSNSHKVMLTIAGKGPLESTLKVKAKELNIESQVSFLGEVPHKEVLSLYKKAHCFVLSSVSEGNPTVAMEALAAGTPVVATRVSGVTDYIEDGVSGLLVPTGDKDALASAMKHMYEDSNLREKLNTQGYEKAKEILSFDAHIASLRRVLGI